LPEQALAKNFLTASRSGMVLLVAASSFVFLTRRDIPLSLKPSSLGETDPGGEQRLTRRFSRHSRNT
jgi:hypothetical protein